MMGVDSGGYHGNYEYCSCSMTHKEKTDMTYKEALEEATKWKRRGANQWSGPKWIHVSNHVIVDFRGQIELDCGEGPENLLTVKEAKELRDTLIAMKLDEVEDERA